MALKKLKTHFVPSETQREDITSAQKWTTGLIDGDGHIGIQWGNKEKTKWSPLLKVSLHVYNARAIYKLKQILKCGKISRHQNMISLRVTREDHWKNLLLPLWDAFPLRSYKHYDVACVRRAMALKYDTRLNLLNKLDAVALLKRQLHQNRINGKPSPIWEPYITSYALLLTLCNLSLTLLPLQKQRKGKRQKQRKGKRGKRGKRNKNDIEKAPLPFINANKQCLEAILDMDWLAGFIEAEGSFYILANGQHGFALGQTYDKHIVAAVHAFYNVRCQLKHRRNYAMLDVKNTSTLLGIGQTLNKKQLGMKSFLFTLWYRTLKKKNTAKSLHVRQIMHRLRQRDDDAHIYF
jgi:LAGLIDADG endonuclease